MADISHSTLYKIPKNCGSTFFVDNVVDRIMDAPLLGNHIPAPCAQWIAIQIPCV